MQSYHYAWLSVHKNRTEGWLKERLEDGFDVHHKDGDHSNNDPTNLVLIECVDHMRLHGSYLNRLLNSGREARRARRDATGRSKYDLARTAYELKSEALSWRDIGVKLNRDSLQPAAWARSAAKRYAEDEGLPFPKPNSDHSRYRRLEPYGG